MDEKQTKRIEKIFPDYFDRFEMPAGAREENIKENGFALNPLADPTDPGQYSLSTFEKPTHVKRFAGAISDMKVPYQIAIGMTNPKHGVVQRTRERKKKSGSHVDWWLYENATPYDEFEIIVDFEKHLQNYIRERDEKNAGIC